MVTVLLLLNWLQPGADMVSINPFLMSAWTPMQLDEVTKDPLLSKPGPDRAAGLDTALSSSETPEFEAPEEPLKAAEPELPQEAAPTPESHVPRRPSGPVRV